MRFKVLFYRFLFAIAGFLLPLIFLAGAAPYIINAEPVKKRLVEELRSWTGSHVELTGPVAIESFFSLSLNARNVEFFAFKGMPQLKTLKAEEIVARIAWMDLFAGRLDFDKIKINEAQIQMRAFDRKDNLTAAETLLAMSRHAQFDAFVLQDATISVDENGQSNSPAAYHLDYAQITLNPDSNDIELGGTLEYNDIRTSIQANLRAGALREPGALLPLDLQLENPFVSASFSGTAKIEGDWRAVGRVSLAFENPSNLGKWMNQPFLDDLHFPVSISGNADITKSRLVLDEAQFSLAEQNATGEFDLIFSGAHSKLLGSVAFGTFDLDAFTESGPSDKTTPDFDPDILMNTLSSMKLDLRLSAESIQFGNIETGDAAFTLLGEDGRYTMEIAHMSIMEGGVFGHAEFDLSGNEPLLKARLTGQTLDASGIQSIVDMPAWLSGNIDGNIEASMSGTSVPGMLANATISGRASFSDEGQIKLDLDRLVSMEKGQEQRGWDGIDSAWSDFDDLRFGFSYESGTLNLGNIALVRSDGTFKGDGIVDTHDQTLDLRVTFVPETATGAAATPQSGSASVISIRGPWSAPILHAVSRANRAATETRNIHKGGKRMERL